MAFGTQGVFQGASIGSQGTLNKAAGGAGGVYGGVISGLTGVATGLINAKRARDIGKFNVQMLDLDKRLARLASGVRIKQIRENAMSLFSTQRARFAKSGFSIEGGQIAVMAESLKQSELDVIFEEINVELGESAIGTKQRIIDMEARTAQFDEFINIGTGILRNRTKFAGR